MHVKLSKAALLYLEPHSVKKDFAQCSTCMMFMKKESQCMIHKKDIKVTGDMSCGYYIEGKPMEHHTMDGKETGLYTGNVRCENCKYFEPPGNCHALEETGAEHDVKHDGCCNGFTATEGTDSMRKKAEMLEHEEAEEEES